MISHSTRSCVDAVQAAFLGDLVAGLTATRDEPGLCRTIECWKARVRADGLDPDALIDLVRRECTPDPDTLRCDSTCIRADKREFVLTCIDVYMRDTAASRSRAARPGGDEQHRNLAVPDDVFGNAAKHHSAQPALAACRHRNELDELVANGVDDHRTNVGRLDDAHIDATAARTKAIRDGAEATFGDRVADLKEDELQHLRPWQRQQR